MSAGWEEQDGAGKKAQQGCGHASPLSSEPQLGPQSVTGMGSLVGRGATLPAEVAPVWQTAVPQDWGHGGNLAANLTAMGGWVHQPVKQGGWGLGDQFSALLFTGRMPVPRGWNTACSKGMMLSYVTYGGGEPWDGQLHPDYGAGQSVDGLQACTVTQGWPFLPE